MIRNPPDVDPTWLWMRTKFDQFAKQLVRAALARRGLVETDAEVVIDPRRVDLWFTPDPTSEPVPDHLGLLGQITAGPSTLEFFHSTPSGDELATCLVKHGQFRHALSLRKPPPPLPTQWVISSGRPVGGIEGLGFRAMVALPILVGLRLEVPRDPAQRTSDDEEFLMQTQDIVETWRQEAVQEGRQEGRQEGFRELLLRLLRRRFGDEVDTQVHQRVAMASIEQVENWSARLMSAATLSELFAD